MKKLLLIIAAFITLSAQAQNDDINLSDVISEILEDAAQQDDEEHYTLAQISSEYLENLAASKLDLNTATWSELQSLPFLTDIKIEAILNYRQKYGCFYSLGELRGIQELTQKDVRFLSCFVMAGEPAETKQPSLHRMLTDGRHSITTTLKTVLEQQKAYREDSLGNKKFDGDRSAVCVKYKYSYKNYIAYGFTAEKDPGEPFGIGDKRYGFDFNSAFIRIQNIGHLEKLILGDYIVKFGQGLILGGGFSAGKSTASTGSASSGVSLREYTSANEYWFYRGAAASIRFKNFGVTAFASRNKNDATLSGDSSSFSTVKTTGYHRTDRELVSKDNYTQYTGGIIATTHIKRFQLGFAATGYKFDKMFEPKEQLRYACTRNERENYCYSLSYHYATTLLSIYGETAMDKECNAATINTIEMRPNAHIKVTAMYRNYSKRYLAFNASALGENSKVNNEEGLYLGAEIYLGRKLALSGYADIFRMPWPTSKVSSGTDVIAQADFKASKRYTVSLKWKCKDKLQSSPVEDYAKNQYIRLQNKFSPSDNTSIANVIQWSDYRYGDTHDRGYLIYQNVTFKPRQIPLTIAARYALFSAPYNARMYAYENDVMYFFSVPAYYYEGCRYYLVLGTQIGKRVKLQTRLSQWRYFDRTTISSGDSQIDGGNKTEVNVYLQVKW